MSFFCDLMKSFNIEDLKNETTISMILGVGIMIVGNIKIQTLGNEQIVILSKKQKIDITGEDLKIKSMTKGEIVIGGNIKNLSLVGGRWWEVLELKFLD